MARINVERKKNVWPWVVGLIVLLLLIWGAFELMDNDRAVYTTDPAVTAPATTGPATTDPMATDPMITNPDAMDPTVTGDAAMPATDETPPPQQ